MEFRRKEDIEESGSGSLPPFNPLTRDSAFSKPLLSSSSSLILSPKPTRPPEPPSNGSIGSGSASASASLTGFERSHTRYRECLHNHAATLGGHVLDGCGEFMPTATDQLKCAACGCHRSFHRKEEPDAHRQQLHHSYHHNSSGGATANRIQLMLPPPHPNPSPQQKNYNVTVGFPTSPLNFGGNSATESSSEERNKGVGEGKRKRFRTKFSSEQKEKMMVFAERVGWRVQKKDEGEMERFCGDIGVSRQVMKVWMHNNKHLVNRKEVEGKEREGGGGEEKEDAEDGEEQHGVN